MQLALAGASARTRRRRQRHESRGAPCGPRCTRWAAAARCSAASAWRCLPCAACAPRCGAAPRRPRRGAARRHLSSAAGTPAPRLCGYTGMRFTAGAQQGCSRRQRLMQAHTRHVSTHVSSTTAAIALGRAAAHLAEIPRLVDIAIVVVLELEVLAVAPAATLCCPSSCKTGRHRGWQSAIAVNATYAQSCSGK